MERILSHSGWLLLAALAATGARADGGARMPGAVPPAYAQECGSCHLAYPPGMLPARSWQRILSGLEQHYGSDASLDAATVRQLDTWLQAHAGTGKRVREQPPEDRITRAAWFERKHREIAPSVWKLVGVKSPANCAACHGGAEQGLFDDDDLKLPAGIARGQRGPWMDND